jgi:hypothetical protein
MGFDEAWLQKMLRKNPHVKLCQQHNGAAFAELHIRAEKRTKYNNKRIKVDGILFDSKKEADYYCDLKLMLKYGFILGFSIQCKFILQEGDEKIKPICYIADFVVFYKDRTVIIDTKGVRTDVYKLKKKMFEKRFGMKIIEV